tara:strand:+ start:2480 stop:2731 length:252 start_codon:yes stop_codon:yes gene_type:complete
MASKRHLRRRDCRSKIRYANGGHANDAVRRAFYLHGELLHRYRCPNCGAWHLGHKRTADGHDRAVPVEVAQEMAQRQGDGPHR